MCTSELRFGVSVQVRDSVSRAAAASGALLVIRDGTYADSMSYPAGHAELDGAPMFGAPERAGVYTLTVSKAGYRDWIRSGIRVTKGECHVSPVTVTALLQPD